MVAQNMQLIIVFGGGQTFLFSWREGGVMLCCSAHKSEAGFRFPKPTKPEAKLQAGFTSGGGGANLFCSK